MDYFIDEFLPKEKKYMVRFTTGEYIPIDFFNDYPDYKEPNHLLGAKEWHFTALNCNDTVECGDVILFNYNELRKINTNIIKFTRGNIVYKKSTQTEYDKYLSKINKNSDNARLYTYLYNLYNRRVRVTVV
jgi:hypothetical protein